VRKNELLLLLMAFALRFKITAAACQALLTLFDMILPGCLPSTNYFVEKLFDFDTRTVQSHYFCSKCMHYFGTSVPQTCLQCDTVYGGDTKLCDSSFMFVLPLIDQLKSLLNKDVIWNCIFQSRCDNSEQLTDVYDGKMYKELKQKSDITLQFNCDGAPVFNSSKFSIWPLVCGINELPTSLRNSNMMLHTLWFGRVKPCVTTFLQPFVSEITDLYNNGFRFVKSSFGQERIINVSATLCICDAPARAMLQDFVQFNGQYGCGFCHHPGERVQKGLGSVQVYPLKEIYPHRTREGTLKLAKKATVSGKPAQGVKGASLLSLLPNFDIVQSFVPDYMHSVLLGVVRQFLTIWTDSSNSRKPYYIKDTSLVDQMLKLIRVPDEINRLPRSLEDRKFWKATEFRSFLLIYSPVILMEVLPKKFYTHWLLLCNAIRLLFQDTVTAVMVTTSRKCLYKFVTLIPELYGCEHVSYNVHILTHLPDAVLNWGPLWSHSAFAFEDVIGVLKSMYHGTQLIPKQTFKYFSAWNKLHNYTALLVHSHESVVDMFCMLSASSKSSWHGAGSRTFAGLRKSSTTISEFQLAAVKDFLQLDCSSSITCQSFDRFLIKDKVFSTDGYASNFRRNNSFVLLRNGCFAFIKSCVAVSSCNCEVAECACSKQILLFVMCCTSTRAESLRDSYVGIDLKQFVRQLTPNDQAMIVVRADDVVCKCVTVQDLNSRSYALQLTQFL